MLVGAKALLYRICPLCSLYTERLLLSRHTKGVCMRVRKAIISFGFVCPSARNNSASTGLVFVKFDFSKIRQKHASFIKTRQEKRLVHRKTAVHLWSYLAQFFLQRELFQAYIVEKIKHTFYVQSLFSPKIVSLWDNVEKCGRVGQAIDDNMERVRISFRILTATHHHSEYVIFVPFSLQK